MTNDTSDEEMHLSAHDDSVDRSFRLSRRRAIQAVLGTVGLGTAGAGLSAGQQTPPLILQTDTLDVAESEPNDSLDTATTLPLNDTATATLTAGDSDVYGVAVFAGPTYEIDLTRQTSGVVGLVLYDPDGGFLDTLAVGEEQSASQVRAFKRDGTHYLQVVNLNDAAGSYRLSVTGKESLNEGGSSSENNGPHHWVEAESASGGTSFEPFVVRSDSTASGRQFITTPDDGRNNYQSIPNGGIAEYTFSVPESGEYTLWARGRGESNSNTFYYSLAGGDPSEWHIDLGGWSWTNLGTRTLSTGEVTVTVYYREDGADLDRLLLTADSGYTPTGMGIEDDRGTGGGTDTPSNQPDPEQSPYGNEPIALTDRIETERFDTGGEGVAYHDSTETNRGSGDRDSSVDIESIGGGEQSVGYITDGEWIEYTVAATPGTYDVDFRVATRYGGNVVRVSLDDRELGTVAIPETGGWQSWTTVTLSDVSVEADGEAILRLEAIGNGRTSTLYNLDWLLFRAVDDGSSEGSETPTEPEPSSQSPYGDSPTVFTDRVEAENFDLGGEGVAFHDASEANQGGSYRSTRVDIEPSSEGGHNVGWIADGEWLEYTIDATPGTYDLNARVATTRSGSTLRVLLDGTKIGEMSVPNTGGWQEYTTVTLSDINIQANGEATLRVEAARGDISNGYLFNLNWLSFSAVNAGSGSGDGNNGGGDGYGDGGFGEGSYSISGTQQTHHRTTLSFDGPEASEGGDPNPFLDYRLQVRFNGPSGQTYDVPGFFAGDGNGEPSGSTWRCHFAPPEPGKWSFKASFREGDEVAITLGDTGVPTAFDGAGGTLSISESEASGRDFRAHGLLRNRGENYLRHSDGTYWIKGGPDIPENFLAHDFDAHGGWRGAIEYIADRGANCLYFLPNNVGGDGDDTWPHTEKFAKTRYDVSKLREWRNLLEFGQSHGVLFHLVLAETEGTNETYYDGGELGPQRKLYYRELTARFGHILGLEWNVGEENDYSTEQHREFAEYLHAVDPYDHPVSVHIRNDDYDIYGPLLGNDDIDMTSFQVGIEGESLADTVADWRQRSIDGGVPWVVSVDEGGVEIDDLDEGRRKEMWPTYMGGGGGYEWYIKNPTSHALDQNLDDFGRIESALKWTGHALGFLSQVPYPEMDYRDDAVSGSKGYTLGSDDEQVYAVYLPDGGDATASVVDGTYEILWTNPRTGEQADQMVRRTNNGKVALSPPFDGDAAAVVRVLN